MALAMTLMPRKRITLLNTSKIYMTIIKILKINGKLTIQAPVDSILYYSYDTDGDRILNEQENISSGDWQRVIKMNVGPDIEVYATNHLFTNWNAH